MVKESLDTPEMLQLGQNVQSDEIIASKNATYKPSELTQRKLQGEDSADAQWTPSSERYQFNNKFNNKFLYSALKLNSMRLRNNQITHW